MGVMRTINFIRAVNDHITYFMIVLTPSVVSSGLYLAVSRVYCLSVGINLK